MKSENLFWVVLFVCITQSFFLIYLSSNIKELETKVAVLSAEKAERKNQKSTYREEKKERKKLREKERLKNIRQIIREELAIGIKSPEADITKSENRISDIHQIDNDLEDQ